MQRGIGKGRTREDHAALAKALYANYAKGRDLRRFEAIVGRDAMSEGDKRILDFADAFERELVHQGSGRRSIVETLDLSGALLARFRMETAA
jgi:V/A-type H+-transporting ATPase subunit B